MKPRSPAFPLLIGIFLIVATGCSDRMSWAEVDDIIETRHPGVAHLSTDSLATWLDDPTRREPLLLDVREAEEYDVSHIYGAYRVDPDDESFPMLENVSSQTPIVTYSSIGVRSAALAERLLERGYTRVLNLRGSLFQWANDGHPLYRGEEEVDEVHPGEEEIGRLLDGSLHATEPR